MFIKSISRRTGLTGTALFVSALLIPSAAFAAPATASASVNVRSGPGTDYEIVDRLRAGERVEVEGCRDGWCYITHSGPDGYVSASYLRRNGQRMERNFNLSFNFPGISIGGGNNQQPPGNNAPGGGNSPPGNSPPP